MSRFLRIIPVILLIAVLLAILFYIYVLHARQNLVSRTLPDSPNPKTALLVIDVQKELVGEASANKNMYPDRVPVIELINRIQQQAAKDSMHIIHIYQNFAPAGQVREDYPGNRFDSRVLAVQQAEFYKDEANAFSNPELDAYLIKNQVSTLYLVGMDAEYCVHSTAKGALANGYKVNVLKDALLMRHPDRWNHIQKEMLKEGCILLDSKDFVRP